MPESFTANFVHCVFSTKDRRDLIPPALQQQLHAYLSGIAKNLGMKMLAVGGTSNHIHLFISLPATLTLAEATQKLKANSSRWLGEQNLEFEWQRGYGAFSVSPSQLNTVQNYLRNQEFHHARRNFGQEFGTLLTKSCVKAVAA